MSILTMNTAATIARILVGLLFTLAGVMSIVISSPPPQPGLAGTFNEIFVHSHWAAFVGAAQLAIGVLLLVNRCVPLALVMLAAFLYNSFAFHITMAPGALPAPIAVLALWVLIAWKYRPLFAQLVRVP